MRFRYSRMVGPGMGCVAIWILIGLSCRLSPWCDPLTFIRLCGHERDWHLIGIWLTCCVTVISSAARTIHWMCESTTTTAITYCPLLQDISAGWCCRETVLLGSTFPVTSSSGIDNICRILFLELVSNCNYLCFLLQFSSTFRNRLGSTTITRYFNLIEVFLSTKYRKMPTWLAHRFSYSPTTVRDNIRWLVDWENREMISPSPGLQVSSFYFSSLSLSRVYLLSLPVKIPEQ